MQHRWSIPEPFTAKLGLQEMGKRKSFALRINENILKAMQRWADDELRSLNGQIEFILREALVEKGRVKLVEKVIIEVEEVSKDKSPK